MIPFKEAFEVLTDREAHLDKINRNKYPKNFILGQISLMTVFTLCYGFIMGSYNSFLQASVTGIKLWLLLLLTLLICFPSFYIVQLVLGSKIRMKQLLVILLSGFVMTTTLMLAFAPIVFFFQLSGDNYSFLQLLHVFVFVFSGFLGMRVVLESLQSAFESDGVYPRIGLHVFRIWVIIFAFVGIQLGWNLRSFLGSKEMPFELLRSETQGNFYSTVGHAFGSMFKGPEKNAIPPKQEDLSAPVPKVKEQPISPADIKTTQSDSLNQ